MHNVRSVFILLGMTLFAALLVAGCSSSEGDEGDTASGASAAADTDAPAQGQSGGLSIQQQFDLSMTFTSPLFNLTDPERKHDYDDGLGRTVELLAYPGGRGPGV